MKTIKIEVLFPEVCNLYGELGNIRYIKESLGDKCEVIETGLNDEPSFVLGDVDLVYMGTMTEKSQLIVLDKLALYKEKIEQAIENNQRFVVTGNAVDIFGESITDLDGMPYDSSSNRVNEEEKRTQCLGILNYKVKRMMLHRNNCLYLGKYEDLDIVGFKSQFVEAFYQSDLGHLFDTVKGDGFNKGDKKEGIRYKNFMATYLIGPLFILNPLFMIKLLNDMGVKDVKPPFFEDAMIAYNKRVEEYKEANRGFYY